jgi:hypothetical protein
MCSAHSIIINLIIIIIVTMSVRQFSIRSVSRLYNEYKGDKQVSCNRELGSSVGNEMSTEEQESILLAAAA